MPNTPGSCDWCGRATSPTASSAASTPGELSKLPQHRQTQKHSHKHHIYSLPCNFLPVRWWWWWCLALMLPPLLLLSAAVQQPLDQHVTVRLRERERVPVGKNSFGQEAVGCFLSLGQTANIPFLFYKQVWILLLNQQESYVLRGLKVYRGFIKTQKGGERPNISICSAAFMWLVLHGQ